MITSLETIAAGVSSRAVEARTGMGWDEWFRLLDKAGGRKKSHAEIVVEVRKLQEVGSWWEQMITRAYEQARGLREKLPAGEGFRVEMVETVGVPAARVFRAWVMAGDRAKWLPNYSVTIRKATPIRTLRATLVDDGSQVDVTIAPKGLHKTQVTVLHTKLSTRECIETMREFWLRALDRLARHCVGL